MSWIVVSKATGKPVLETFSASVASRINTEKYEVLDAEEWLMRFNAQVKSLTPGLH